MADREQIRNQISDNGRISVRQLTLEEFCWDCDRHGQARQVILRHSATLIEFAL